MHKFGLPTYPIYSGMIIGGDRELEEIEWLLEHGIIQSDLYRYRKILKMDGRYHLVKNTDDRYSNTNEKIADATTIEMLIHDYNVNLACWYWYESEAKS
jgi:hypothetical protein